MKLSKLYSIALAFFIALSCLQVHATHIVGGEISAEFLSADSTHWTYRITLKVYKDCGPAATGPFDDPLYLAVFDAGNNLFRLDTFTLPLTGPQLLDVVVSNPCLQAPPNICTQLGIYEKVLRFPISTGGYTLTYQRCCRNAGIANMPSPGATGSTYTMRIPGTNEIGNSPNSSPVYNSYPPLVLCLNDNLTFNHSAADKDGDSLVYSFCTPYSGGSRASPRPLPPSTPPYTNIVWGTGFSGSYQIPSSPAFSIDPVTGIITGAATSIGKYVVGVCVAEYRNGIFLSENKRDFQFTVTQCDPNSIAAASSQERFCEGLSVTFKNNSQNALGYFWDFGDPTTAADTSTLFEPTWTYADTGKYVITLIANPGLSCADTIETVYEIYELLEPFFERPDGQCFEEHSFDLNAGGIFEPYANFEWVYGSSAVSTGSFEQNPTNIRFTEPGIYPITLIIRLNGCEEEFTDSLFVYPKAEPSFDVEERSGCVPIKVAFNNSSKAWTPMTYFWDFGDGKTSTEENPVHVYPEPGIYNVSLLASTNEVCTSAVNMLKIGFIRVNELPKARIYVENPIASITNPVVRFQDRSQGGTICKLDLGDGLQSPFCDYDHRYWQSGKYTVRQVVYTQFGCTDTNAFDVFIKPAVSLFIPNTFTPNSDKVNEVYRAYGEPVLEYDFRIYNRWGQLVFTSNRIEGGWDGFINGKPAPSDKYAYYIKLMDALGDEAEFRGTFLLLK
ncbi:MAG: PKD domain-containing protein [Vicingaceae bacterium]